MSMANADLVVGRVYPGGPNLADEPLHKLLGVGNMGGIRTKKAADGTLAYVVLFSTESEDEWPDGLDITTGRYVYFGDNRTPGKALLESDGNKVFDRLAQINVDDSAGRAAFPPFLIFKSAADALPRSVVFVGVGVPSCRPTTTDWCVAKYFGADAKFPNFVISLDVLADGSIPPSWISDLLAGNDSSQHRPPWFDHWVETGETVVAVPSTSMNSAPQSR
jgi:hypothetical protein